MKSNFIATRNLNNDKNITTDIEVLFSMNDNAIQDFLKKFEEIYFTETKDDEENFLNELGKKHDGKTLLFVQLFRISKLFVGVFLKENPADTPSNIVEDFLGLGWIEKSNENKLLLFLNDLKKITGQIRPKYRTQMTVNSSLPSLIGLHSTVDFRIVFDETNDSAVSKEYEPKIIGFVPMALITLHLDEGLSEHVYFQVDEKRLELLMKYLKNIQKEIEAAKKVRMN